MKYISIDGDDIGSKITSCYLSNNEVELQRFSLGLKEATNNISSLLVSRGFDILFCAADGVVASIQGDENFTEIFQCINEITAKDISFSAGVGASLREAYVALLAAKSNGKKCLYHYSEIARIVPNDNFIGIKYVSDRKI